ncbi:unnamed protein product [Cuscuta campestris]|uniref:CCHC-type domain-containing protein n=1 Tax=Cuscuta campestris TaxID=132261 RepID=A0A484KV50_9ASTE|nr:unnamed protein product [Cuscuta campestris]
MANNNTNNLALRSILDKDKLNGTNFVDWQRNLSIVLRMDEKEYVLEKPIPPAPPANAPKAVKDAYEKHVKDDNLVSYVMLATMITELQKQHKDMKAHEMIVALRQLYQGQSRHERFLVSKALFSCKLSSGNPVGPHVLKMIGYITNLEKLGFSLQKELATDLILQSLPERYKGFVMNYMMYDLDKPLPELLKMLQTAEENLTKGKGASVLMVQGGKGKPKKGIKIKARTVEKPKSKSTSYSTQKPIGGVAKGKCHYCGKAGHWRRNCKTYLATKKKEGTTISSEGLKQSRRLARGEIKLRVGNGACVVALEIGTYSLVLPSGLIKNVFYANANMTNGLYVLDLDMPVYNISAKRNKPNGLNQTLWHCRLGHINEKRISKLHRSGMLESFDLESYDTCESCLLGNDIPTLTTVKTWLSKSFSMKDLGDASYALGIRIYRDRSRKLLGTSLSKTQGAFTPEEVERMRNVPYASAIGSIMYAMVCTRPNVSFALSVTSRYQSNPGESHWTAMKNILKYFRRTKDAFLVYGRKEELSIVGYTDARFQTDRDHFKSQAGYVFFLNGGAVTWKSYKQDTTADSTTEGEYMAAAEATKEGVWLNNFITELGVVPSIKNPIPLFCDNNGAIAQVKEPRSHQKTKHIVRSYHIIREIVARGDVEICKIDTDDNIADPLRKALGKPKHESHTWSMGIREMLDWP